MTEHHLLSLTAKIRKPHCDALMILYLILSFENYQHFDFKWGHNCCFFKAISRAWIWSQRQQSLAGWEALFKSPAERELNQKCCISRMQDVCMWLPKSLWHPSDKFSLDAGYTLGVCFWWFKHHVIINHRYSTGILWSSQQHSCLSCLIPAGVIPPGRWKACRVIIHLPLGFQK